METSSDDVIRNSNRGTLSEGGNGPVANRSPLEDGLHLSYQMEVLRAETDWGRKSPDLGQVGAMNMK
jgi:hypothetical protein